MTPEEFTKQTPLVKTLILIDQINRVIERCDDNIITKNSWVQATFRGLAERLEELATDLIPLDFDLMLKEIEEGKPKQ